MKVAKPTTRVRRTLEEDVEMAALVALAEDPNDDADGGGLEEELILGDVADEVAPVALVPVLLTAALVKS
jgi:hypothetical protein